MVHDRRSPTRRAILAGGGIAGSLVALPATGAQAMTTSMPAGISAIRHKRVQADGVDIFYREAGREDCAPFPASSWLRQLVILLPPSDAAIGGSFPPRRARYSLIWLYGCPDRAEYEYTFASLSKTMRPLSMLWASGRYILYVFDYGAPVGWDLALTYPDRVAGIVSQNGNAYVEGLGEKAWAPLRAYWANPKPALREALRGRMTLDGVKPPISKAFPTLM